jgi:uncharacterized protein YchJ
VHLVLEQLLETGVSIHQLRKLLASEEGCRLDFVRRFFNFGPHILQKSRNSRVFEFNARTVGTSKEVIVKEDVDFINHQDSWILFKLVSSSVESHQVCTKFRG